MPEGTKLTVKQITADAAAGDVIDVDLQLPQEYEGSHLLTLKIDADYIDKDVAIFYFNENTEKWENIGGKIDYEKQTISTVVTHFSQYGVFVVDNEDQGETEPGDGTELVDGEDPGDGTDPGEVTDPGKEDQDENVSVDPSDDNETPIISDGNGNRELPKTATSLYNFLALGGALLLIGLILAFTFNRKKAHN